VQSQTNNLVPLRRIPTLTYRLGTADEDEDTSCFYGPGVGRLRLCLTALQSVDLILVVRQRCGA